MSCCDDPNAIRNASRRLSLDGSSLASWRHQWSSLPGWKTRIDRRPLNVPGSALAAEPPVPQHNVPDNEEQNAPGLDMVWEPVGKNAHPHAGYELRDRTTIRRPVCYTE
eukprot:scpid61670/ scgid33778/ 